MIFIIVQKFRCCLSLYFERLTQGDITTLVQSGVMQPKNMQKVRITRERLLAQLRSKSIKNLGSIKRPYIEAEGSFTMIREDKSQPGLSIIPDWDIKFANRQMKKEEIQVCFNCGKQKANSTEIQCSNCGKKDWVTAIL